MEINQEMHLEKVNKFNAEGYLIHRKFYDVQMIKNILEAGSNIGNKAED